MDAIREELITTGGQAEFRLFGEVELREASQLLDVDTPRQQTVLAELDVDPDLRDLHRFGSQDRPTGVLALGTVARHLANCTWADNTHTYLPTGKPKLAVPVRCHGIIGPLLRSGCAAAQLREADCAFAEVRSTEIRSGS